MKNLSLFQKLFSFLYPARKKRDLFLKYGNLTEKEKNFFTYIPLDYSYWKWSLPEEVVEAVWYSMGLTEEDDWSPEEKATITVMLCGRVEYMPSLQVWGIGYIAEPDFDFHILCYCSKTRKIGIVFESLSGKGEYIDFIDVTLSEFISQIRRTVEPSYDD